MLDLNYLLSREQISLVRAANAASREARAAHAGLARAYGALLDARDCSFGPYPFRHATARLHAA